MVEEPRESKVSPLPLNSEFDIIKRTSSLLNLMTKGNLKGSILSDISWWGEKRVKMNSTGTKIA